MKSSEVEILIIPGWTNSGPDHWQSRWEMKLSTARRVEQADWDRPKRAEWMARIEQEIKASTKPVVLVAHSLGVLAAVSAARNLDAGAVRGGFFVAPPDATQDGMPPEIDPAFAAVPTGPLTFPSLLVASRNDPYCAYDVADGLAADWGSLLVDAGESGHLNTASGHGPWPEGLTRFAMLLQRL